MVVARPKIGLIKVGVIFILVLFYYYEGIMVIFGLATTTTCPGCGLGTKLR